MPSDKRTVSTSRSKGKNDDTRNRVDSRDRKLRDEPEQVPMQNERLLVQDKRLLRESEELMTKLESLLNSYESLKTQYGEQPSELASIRARLKAMEPKRTIHRDRGLGM